MLDSFAGSGATGKAVFELNAKDSIRRRFCFVQLPEPLDKADKDQKAAAASCATLGKPRNLAELFRDNAFADDVAKSNLTAILQQYGLENVRSL